LLARIAPSEVPFIVRYSLATLTMTALDITPNSMKFLERISQIGEATPEPPSLTKQAPLSDDWAPESISGNQTLIGGHGIFHSMVCLIASSPMRGKSSHRLSR
jgi:hypothetical protein